MLTPENLGRAAGAPQAHRLYDDLMKELQNDTAIDITTRPSARELASLRERAASLLETKLPASSSEARARVEQEMFGSGPLESLLNDPEVTEILINGHQSVWYEKQGRLHAHYDRFFTSTSLNNFLQRLMTEARIQANLERPFADGYWQKFRLHIILPPLAPSEVHISLRRHPENPWTFKAFLDSGWAPNHAIEMLQKLVREYHSFLVIGGTGSGKTSVLNACLQELSSNERVVTIEDTNEIRLPNQASVKLISRQDPSGILQDVDQCELLRQALRMRPDRIVVGEVRGHEAKDLLMALSTGHRGGMGTLHAENPRQALLRLEMLVQLGAPQWSLRAIRHLIFFGIQYVVTISKTGGMRKLKSISRLTSLEENGFCLEPIYEIE